MQFDRPRGSVQTFHRRAADAYSNVEAIRLSALEAVWRLSRDLPADEHVAVAKFSAAAGGQSAAVACQHLHGGIGIDVSYPLHRHFVWAVQIEHELGAARHHPAGGAGPRDRDPGVAAGLAQLPRLVAQQDRLPAGHVRRGHLEERPAGERTRDVGLRRRLQPG